jgi:hypothetical protein
MIGALGADFATPQDARSNQYANGSPDAADYPAAGDKKDDPAMDN